jgi:hypothetical protein
MAKFAQNRVPLDCGMLNLRRGEADGPEKEKDAPIQDALQKLGADLSINRSAEESLVTKAHVFCPFHSR